MMNTKHKNYMYMLQRVEKVLDENRTTWEAEERMTHLYNEFKYRVDRLAELFGQKRELTLPYKKVKTAMKEEFADKILQLAGFLHEIGETKGDKQLKLYSNTSRTQLVFGTIQECLTKSQNILELAMTHRNELGIFSHGEAVLEDAKEQLESFQTNGFLPYDRRNRLRDTNREIHDLITETRSFLSHRLDRVMFFYNRRNSAFYSSYKLNRVIPKISATRSTSEEVVQSETRKETAKGVLGLFRAS